DTADPRQELFTIAAGDTMGQLAAQAQLLSTASVQPNTDGTFTVQTSTFTTADGDTLCSATSFYGEATVNYGATAFLVGADLVFTAAHTFGVSTIQDAQAACAVRYLVANFALTSASEECDQVTCAQVTTRPASDVYRCIDV